MGKSNEGELPEIDWKKFATEESHPLRIGILECLRLDGGRALTPSDLAVELRAAKVNLVCYHVEVLQKRGLIEVCYRDKHRGGTRTFYEVPNGPGQIAS
jgi:Helix-turn-helix domain